MKPWELLGQTQTPDGSDMTLMRRDTEVVILANGKPLMSSRMHGSEEALAIAGCRLAQKLAHLGHFSRSRRQRHRVLLRGGGG